MSAERFGWLKIPALAGGLRVASLFQDEPDHGTREKGSDGSGRGADQRREATAGGDDRGLPCLAWPGAGAGGGSRWRSGQHVLAAGVGEPLDLVDAPTAQASTQANRAEQAVMLESNSGERQRLRSIV